VNSQTSKLAVGSLILLVMTLVASCGGGSSTTGPTATPTPTPTPAAGAADVTVVITGENDNMSFSPNPATVKVGQTVAWRNGDFVEHHSATADLGAFNTGIINPQGTSKSITVATAGSFGYHCEIHRSMVGTLNVIQ
jgi:plastocyanin